MGRSRYKVYEPTHPHFPRSISPDMERERDKKFCGISAGASTLD